MKKYPPNLLHLWKISQSPLFANSIQDFESHYKFS